MNIASMVVMGLAAVFMCTSVTANENFHVSSQARGVDAFDHQITEVTREDHYSVLQVSDFQSRSAAASRWMMCVYAELALDRNKPYLASVYGDDSGNEVYLLFPPSDSINAENYRDVELDVEGSRVVKTSDYRRFCDL